VTHHFGLDQRFERVDFAVVLALHEFHFTECTLTDDLERGVVLWPLAGAEEA